MVHARFSAHFLAKQVAPQIPVSRAIAEKPISTPKDEVANFAIWSALLVLELNTVF
jgi:hypothetical protein